MAIVIPYEPTLQALLPNVDEGIHVVDHAGVTVLYNPQAGLNDGLDPEEVIGKHLLQVFPSLNERTSTFLKVLATGDPIVHQEQTFTNYKGLRIITVNSTWPIHQQGRLVGAVEVSKNITRVRELSEQVVGLQAELIRRRKRRTTPPAAARFTMDDLIGRDPALEAVKQQALRAASGTVPILVCGETGTGKEILVQAIHQASPRRGGPLVAQNCAALPEGLLEGILFGTAKGGFTGAEDRPGLFELADGGSLYLDEINSMDLNLQAKLLRVLQDGRVRRVGASEERQVDVRMIVSANEPPEKAVAERRLRQDLYYRINVVCLELPPLRERRRDISVLTQHFLAKHRKRIGSAVNGMSQPVERLFAIYPWPGNVRELEHAIESALHMAQADTIRLHDLPAHLLRAAVKDAVPPGTEALDPGTPNPSQWRTDLAAAEHETLTAALRATGWNVSRAARLLGIPRQTLQYRIKLLQISQNNMEG